MRKGQRVCERARLQRLAQGAGASGRCDKETRKNSGMGTDRYDWTAMTDAKGGENEWTARCVYGGRWAGY